MTLTVTFLYRPGLSAPIFTGARLTGSWDAAGRPSAQWTTVAMRPTIDDAGCPAFSGQVSFPDEMAGQRFDWGVVVDRPGAKDQWGIPTDRGGIGTENRTRTFTLGLTLEPTGQVEEYYLTYLRRLGANKLVSTGGSEPGIRFAVWAPNARAVELVFGDVNRGYVADEPDAGKNGAGATSKPGEFPMTKDLQTGVWSIDSKTNSRLGTFASRDHSAAYMFKITRDDGSTTYRTDLYSRCQIGQGKTDPMGAVYGGLAKDLDGSKSCSIVVDPERVMRDFDEPFPQRNWVSEEEFWRDELDPKRPLPTRVEDLVIYELHVPGLVTGSSQPGHLKDAIGLLDHLVDLGVNAVELMPMSEYEGWAEWGYGTSHYFAVEYVSGGRDQFKHFVRECHKRGIAVILDVVYNHYTHSAERAQWAYDSPEPTRNIYYWYEGKPTDYPDFQSKVDAGKRGDGGYIDNVSTGWAPRYWEEPVRHLFISSAVALVTEFHLDGFRVDQTTSIRSYATVHADGRPADAARAHGAKFLREWTRTLRMIKPTVMLVAEDHDEWSGVVTPADQGGLGFDASWFARFYHNLAGDTGHGADSANLLRDVGVGDDRPLQLDQMARLLEDTSPAKVVYHESHDEAGNSHGDGNPPKWVSARTINVAVNNAPLIGETRRYAEARSRVAATLSILSAGVPMFFMGEEVGCREPYRYDDFMEHREDIAGMRTGIGQKLFRYYHDLIETRKHEEALRGGGLNVVYVHDDNRVLAFRRVRNGTECLVVCNLANHPYDQGYELVTGLLPDHDWREVLNSDAATYGGDNVGNFGSTIPSRGGHMRLRLPANGALVLEKVS